MKLIILKRGFTFFKQNIKVISLYELHAQIEGPNNELRQFDTEPKDRRVGSIQTK